MRRCLVAKFRKGEDFFQNFTSRIAEREHVAPSVSAGKQAEEHGCRRVQRMFARGEGSIFMGTNLFWRKKAGFWVNPPPLTLRDVFYE